MQKRERDGQRSHLWPRPTPLHSLSHLVVAGVVDLLALALLLELLELPVALPVLLLVSLELLLSPLAELALLSVLSAFLPLLFASLATAPLLP